MTGEALKELNLYKLNLARDVVRAVLPLNHDESLLMVAAIRAIEALIKINGGDDE